MAVQPEPSGRRRTSEPDDRSLPARDRLLNALASNPALSKEVAEELQRAIQEAREASIGDSIPS